MGTLLIFPQADVLLDDINQNADRVIQSPLPCCIGATDRSVYVAIATLQGQWVIATFDLGLLLTAAEAFAITHGDPRTTGGIPC